MCTRGGILVIFLAFAIVLVKSAHYETQQQQQDQDIAESRKGPFFLSRFWYLALPWIFAFKIKVVIIAVAVTLLILKFWAPYSNYSYGGYTGYSSIPGEEWQDIPQNRMLTDQITGRVMTGLETAEMTWRAAANDDENCGARLACEARRSARSDKVAANMVNALGHSLDELDRTRRSSDCENIPCYSIVSKLSDFYARKL